MTTNELLKHYLTLPYAELKEIARKDAAEVEKYMGEIDNVERAKILVAGSVYTCVAVDGDFSVREWQFLCDVFEYRDYESFKKIIAGFYGNIEEAGTTTKGVLSIIRGKARSAFISLCLATVAVDSSVLTSEADIINKILGF